MKIDTGEQGICTGTGEIVPFVMAINHVCTRGQLISIMIYMYTGINHPGGEGGVTRSGTTEEAM
jgi:hypothetical protein